MATIVSCYYQLDTNTKRSPSQYKSWITNLLQFCEQPIVMFSDGPIADELDTFRKAQSPQKANNWILIKRPLQSLSYTSPDDMAYWSWCLEQDPNAHLHTPEMFIFWANKTQLLKEILLQNPFNTSHFFWCDAGCWRDSRFAEVIAPQWPLHNKSNALPDQLLLTWIANYESLKESTKSFETLDQYVCHDAFRGQCTVAGAIFGGPAASVLVFANLFSKVFDLYKLHKKFAGDDQALLATLGLFLERKGLVQNVPCYTPPEIRGADNWFALQYLL